MKQNQFISFLNQFNALSPNHSKIYDEYLTEGDKFYFSIETKIEKYLLRRFKEQPCSVILSGNAGDGKTRLCRTIYEYFTNKKLNKWPDTGIIDIDFPHGKLRIVKDLSELTDDVISNELHDLQIYIEENHASNIYYLIAANEGKLTKTLSDDVKLSKLHDMIQRRFLNHEANDDQLVLVNLQDVTSSIYAERIIKEWNREEYWEACEKCDVRRKCVIFLNHKRTSQSRIQNRLVEQYRLLDCLGVHITMREILIHISYVLTGGLTCESVLSAGYKDLEEHSNRIYYENFYGTQLDGESLTDQGAIRYFKQLDPGKISISRIDDFLLNGDLSGDEQIVNQHKLLFDDEIDTLFGYYQKLIERYRFQVQEDSSISENKNIFHYVPKLRRKYFFEIDEINNEARQKLLPFHHFHRFLECLDESGRGRNKVKRDLIRGLNHSFLRKLIHSDNSSILYVANENLLIHNSYPSNQVLISTDNRREDIDYLPSKLFISINHEERIVATLPLFEYLLRIARGGLYSALGQEVEIMLNTFRNDLINKSELDEFAINVFSLDIESGVYKPYEIVLDSEV